VERSQKAVMGLYGYRISKGCFVREKILYTQKQSFFNMVTC